MAVGQDRVEGGEAPRYPLSRLRRVGECHSKDGLDARSLQALKGTCCQLLQHPSLFQLVFIGHPSLEPRFNQLLSILLRALAEQVDQVAHENRAMLALSAIVLDYLIQPGVIGGEVGVPDVVDLGGLAGSLGQVRAALDHAVSAITLENIEF